MDISLLRTRWAAIGAAIAVAFGAGGYGLGHAALDNGVRSVFVPIAPCRLLDTRPGADNVGPRNTPLGPADTMTQQVTGNNGQCSGIPGDATAIAMNVTAVGGSADSYLTLFPANLTEPPNASNLNWRAGDPPAPNKVDVQLSPAGAVKIYNRFGSVDVIADVVGYYQDHHHDDRYHTQAETQAMWGSATCQPQSFRPFDPANTTYSAAAGLLALNPDPGNIISSNFYCPVELPVGATVSRLDGYYSDTLGGVGSGFCQLTRRGVLANSAPSVVSTSSTVDQTGFSTVSGTPAAPVVVGPDDLFLVRCTIGSTVRLSAAEVSYTLPA